ncbi:MULTISPECIES: GNAT family N-acetyltransferase [unclassified Sphingobium]|uniref:GNAT family N-acetyltransferase n=1 Tax=unclassified Sphingobium TaxID=2611147 RepID=UPI000C9FC5BB|nr:MULTISPECIES: GNAT family N-acetyltransferase [unclassified Sphingobium]PNP98724.1 acetyltransferase [Sphingobium sp. SA916]UXC91685.1 GNAT family N-acetyltransferase [Sphingobium sp. RSMS]
MRSFELRAARDSDLDRLQFISAQARERYRSIPALSHIADAPPLTTDRFKACHVAVAIGLDDPSPIGFAASRPLDGLLYLDNISIAADASGRGIGSALLSSVIKHAVTLRAPAVSLTTFRQPAWNGPWFRRHGFKTMRADRIGVGLREVMERQRRTLDPDSRETLLRIL